MKFLKVENMTDGDLILSLSRTVNSDPERGYLPVYVFDMIHAKTKEKMGELKLKIGSLPEYIGHIGYRVFPDYRGHGYATRSCQLAAVVARKHNMSRIVMTCRDENIASWKTCERLRAKFVGMVQMPEGYKDWIGPVKAKRRYVWEISSNKES